VLPRSPSAEYVSFVARVLAIAAQRGDVVVKRVSQATLRRLDSRQK
jgi:hypothetical protein